MSDFLARRIRIQFSLAALFGLMTLCAFGTWYWYQRPFEIETKVADPFGPGSTHREVETVRRLWGGKTMRHGPLRVYDAKGNLTTLENYRNGEKHGPSIRYTAKGAKASEQAFVHGKHHGLSQWWDSNGTVITEENYANDLRHGQFLHRHPDGKVSIDAKFDQGAPTGKWSWFPMTKKSDGQTSQGTIHGEWKNALPQGRWEWRDADDQVYLAIDFEDGHVVAPQELVVQPRALESVVYAAGKNPTLMSVLFRPVNIGFQDVYLKDALLRLQNAARVPIRFDLRSMYSAHISPDTPISAKITDEPLLIGISKMLRPYRLDCTFRYGMLCVAPASDLEIWEDLTGISGLVPPPGSHLANAWTRTTSVDVVEMPLKDVALYLQEVHRIRFDLSLMPPAQSLITPTTNINSPVTVSLRGITLKDALATILDNLGCKASLRGEVIVLEPQ